MVTNDTATRTDLSGNAVEEISSNLRRLLADVFALYVKTKNFHWHISGRHFRDYHLLLDEQATQIFAITDTIAERARKIGGTTIRSISDIARNQRLKDNNKESVSPQEMIGAPGQLLDIEPVPEDVPDRTHGFDRFRRRLDADAVAGDDSYTHLVIG